MSEMLWCDLGQHPFSANDSERKTWSEELTYMEAQQGKRPKRMDACGPCQTKSPEKDPVRALMGPQSKAAHARASGYDEEYVAWLEKQNGIVSDE